MSALRTGRLYTPGNITGTHFCHRLSQPQSHSAAGRIMSMNNSSDTIGNRPRDLPACSAVPQTTAPLRCMHLGSKNIYAEWKSDNLGFPLKMPPATQVETLGQFQHTTTLKLSVDNTRQRSVCVCVCVCVLVRAHFANTIS